jgi:hypothetical protein
VTKETGGSALRNQKGTAAAELVLPGDDRVVPASVALDEAVAIFWINIAAEFPAALLGSKCPNHFPEAGIARIGKALSTGRTTGPHATALFCLRILRTVCVWIRTRAANRGKLCVTMSVNESSTFINAFPLRYIPDTADFNSGWFAEE